jgi:hypothetical protein
MLSDTEASCLARALAVCLKKKKKHRWMEWLTKINKYTHENLLRDLRVSEPSDFQNFLQIDATSFDEPLKMIMPQIEKRNTTMQDAIPPSQHLSITLRYLATGNTFEDLKFTYAISPQSIGVIVMETCTAFDIQPKGLHKGKKKIVIIQNHYFIYCCKYSFAFIY